MFRRFYY